MTCLFILIPLIDTLNIYCFAVENLLGHLTLDVYESDKDKMREEHFNLTKDYSSDEELDAISLYTNSIPG